MSLQNSLSSLPQYDSSSGQSLDEYTKQRFALIYERVFGPANKLNQAAKSATSSSLSVPPKETEEAAPTILAVESLSSTQRAVQIGSTIPLIFCREVSGNGGVLVSPPAVRAAFQVTPEREITANYVCVVSDGQISSIAATDVWHGGRKLTELSSYTFQQAYSMIPGNVVLLTSITTDNPEDVNTFPTTVGSGGSLSGLSVIGVQAIYPAIEGSNWWNQQVHCFVRNGLPVTRLVDGVAGASNNFCDLVKYLLDSSGRVSAALVDTAALTLSAKFTEALGLHYNGVLDNRSRFKDFITEHAALFLLTTSNVNGKFGLKPVLPITSAFQLDTGVITPVATFTLQQIVEGSYSLEYTPLETRKFFRAEMKWRYQPPGEAAEVRTATVGYEGYAVNGPFESYDLSTFCTSEAQAIKVGRYIMAQRRYADHTIAFKLRPGSPQREPGEIVRVTINRLSSASTAVEYSRLYQITSITEDGQGQIDVTATHFPVDAQGRSIVALEVAGATAAVLAPTTSPDQCPPNVPTETEPEPVQEPEVNNPYIVASGGTVSYDGDFKIHIFTANTNFVVSNVPDGSTLEYLIVGGGGAGGVQAGGGGGEVLTGSLTPTRTSYAITVGAGGKSGSLNVDGGSSTAFSLTARGGKRGNSPGSGGASGNGVSGGSTGSRYDDTYITAMGGGGGGGGASGSGSSGQDYTSSSGRLAGVTAASGGNGGAGVSSSITGTALTYGSGGGGASGFFIAKWNTAQAWGRSEWSGSGTAGTGGSGAANGTSYSGEGTRRTILSHGTPAAANRGGGGGGGGSTSAEPDPHDGAAGVVIVRYRYQN